MARRLGVATDNRLKVRRDEEVFMKLQSLLQARVVVNLVIGSNNATTLNGSSQGLSSPEDRRRFHEIRSACRSIVIGGSTFRSNPYKDPPLPLYVATRSSAPLSDPRTTFMQSEPSEVVERALHDHGAPVLVEGGVRFITSLIQNGLVDLIFLTRTNRSGDSDFVDCDELLRGFESVESEVIDGERFEMWVRRTSELAK